MVTMIRTKNDGERVLLYNPSNPTQTISSVWSVANPIIDSVFGEYGSDAVITSDFDGKHKDGSLHYVGRALDFRLWDVDNWLWDSLTHDLAKALGPDFDVVLERAKSHIHIEFQPKGVAS